MANSKSNINKRDREILEACEERGMLEYFALTLAVYIGRIEPQREAQVIAEGLLNCEKAVSEWFDELNDEIDEENL